MTSNNIGENIGKLRTQRGLSQADVAKAIGVRRETVTQWENGTRDLKTKYTLLLADLFNVTCDEILRGVKAENIQVSKEFGLSDEAIEALKIINLWSSEGTGLKNVVEALNFLVTHREFRSLLVCLRDLGNPEIFKLNEKAGFDNLYRIARDLTSPQIRVIDGIQYRATRIFGDIMEDILKANPGSKEERFVDSFKSKK